MPGKKEGVPARSGIERVDIVDYPQDLEYFDSPQVYTQDLEYFDSPQVYILKT